MADKWRAHRVWTTDELEAAVLSGRMHKNRAGDAVLMDEQWFSFKYLGERRWVLRPIRAGQR